jgi:hypothetical protein
MTDKIVHIYVEGGVIQDIDVPMGVKVEVYDFDIDGAEHISKSPLGEDCVHSTWEYEHDRQVSR